jgi:hypothetical protein
LLQAEIEEDRLRKLLPLARVAVRAVTGLKEATFWTLLTVRVRLVVPLGRL